MNGFLAKGDIFNAADLLEHRLRVPEEALELLLGTWPSSLQAASCIGVTFQLLGRLGRHETALKRIALIAMDDLSVRRVPFLQANPPQIVGASATATPGQVAVLSAYGELTVYDLPTCS